MVQTYTKSQISVHLPAYGKYIVPEKQQAWREIFYCRFNALSSGERLVKIGYDSTKLVSSVGTLFLLKDMQLTHAFSVYFHQPQFSKQRVKKPILFFVSHT